MTRAPEEYEESRTVLKLSICAILVLLLQGILLMVVSSSEGSLPSAEISVSHPSPTNPVILLGFPRSGSLAIHRWFECQGWTSSHYCCGGNGSGGNTATKFPCLDENAPTCGDCVLKNLKNHRLAFENCGTTRTVWSQYDVETADGWFLPQHFALGLLHESYPNATWILNTRNSSREWAESIFHWHSMTRRFLTSFDLEVEPHHAMTNPPPGPHDKVTAEEIEADMQRQLEARVYNQTEHLRKLVLLEKIYKNHTATIYQWASQFPSHQFVHITVDDDHHHSVAALQRVFGLDSTTKNCPWTFESPTNDWKNFTFPFGS